MMPYPDLHTVILASASPRRQELLKTLNIDFSIRVAEIDETPYVGEAPKAFAERMAEEKAGAVDADPESTVIAADTIVVADNTILGKPADEAHAVEMLTGLSGKTHEVITAVCVKRGPKCRVISVSTEVDFRTLTPDEMDAYVASGCPMDKAGAYAIQGGAAHMVRAINGSYTNVVGLPLCELHEMLLSF
ncbi:MAG: septum formation inhibitor Maf [Pontiellaceae bacterium]|nr:septum formation inhibitor Maf [Pontiellaceae bacterium]